MATATEVIPNLPVAVPDTVMAPKTVALLAGDWMVTVMGAAALTGAAPMAIARETTRDAQIQRPLRTMARAPQ